MSNDSEAICEVVQITEILPHPNADKLEIAKFATKSGPSGYTCVIGKEQFRVGDLAVYCGVDCVVPLEQPPGVTRDVTSRWEFLRTRPEYQGKATARIRAAKLRGVYSEGILMPINEPGAGIHFSGFVVGNEFWDAWMVDYYMKPVRLAKLDNSPKPNPVNAHWRRVFPEYGVLSLRKLPNLFQEGEDVIITEKIHGTNARFGWAPSGWRGYRFLVGSHHMIKTDLRPWWKRLFSKQKKAGYYKDDVWNKTAEKYGLAKRLKDYKGFIFYGEIYGEGIQDLTYGSKEHKLRIFDIWDTNKEEFLGWWDFIRVCADLELDTVPMCIWAKFNMDMVKAVADDQSWVEGAKHIAEGVVVRSMDSSRVAKYVGENYRLRKTADKETVDPEMRQEINEYTAGVA